MTLAERLDKICEEFDHYSYMDSDYSVEQAEHDIKNRPEFVIDGLLDMIEVLLEERSERFT